MRSSGQSGLWFQSSRACLPTGSSVLSLSPCACPRAAGTWAASPPGGNAAQGLAGAWFSLGGCRRKVRQFQGTLCGACGSLSLPKGHGSAGLRLSSQVKTKEESVTDVTVTKSQKRGCCWRPHEVQTPQARTVSHVLCLHLFSCAQQNRSFVFQTRYEMATTSLCPGTKQQASRAALGWRLQEVVIWQGHSRGGGRETPDPSLAPHMAWTPLSLWYLSRGSPLSRPRPQAPSPGRLHGQGCSGRACPRRGPAASPVGALPRAG